MKTLRRKFREFREETLRRLWELENPPRFQYGEVVFIVHSNEIRSWAFRHEYKGVKEIKTEYNKYSDTVIFFTRICYIDDGLGISEKEEYYIKRLDDLNPQKTWEFLDTSGHKLDIKLQNEAK